MNKFSIVLFFVLGCSPLIAQQKTSFDLKKSIDRGQLLYRSQCETCHLDGGGGIKGVYPPLAKSDYLMANEKRAIALLLRGINGPIRVNGIDYDGEMPRVALSNEELADVLNYIRNSFGNKGEAITPASVATMRK